MKSFSTENPDRTWTLTIDVNAIRRVRALAQVDLMDAIKGDLLDKLADDPVLLVDVLYVLCREQADAAKITDEQFGKAIIGDVIEQAVDALLEELADFFPKRRREILHLVKAKAQKLQNMGLDQATDLLAGDLLEKRFLAESQRLRDSLLKTAGGSSTNAPGSPESTPAP